VQVRVKSNKHYTAVRERVQEAKDYENQSIPLCGMSIEDIYRHYDIPSEISFFSSK
jgi:hypothetical protein